MWTILIDNPLHDDLTIKLIHMTVNAIRLPISKILLRTTHIPIELFSFDVELTEAVPETDIIYMTGKTGLTDLPDITESVSDLTNDFVIKYQNDMYTKPILVTIGLTDPAHRSYVREYGISTDIKTVPQAYMFYPKLDLDADVTSDTTIALNSQGYGYDKVSFLKAYVRYDDPKRGLFVRKTYTNTIPKILYLLSDTSKDWHRVLTSDWTICQDTIIADRWVAYQSYYEDSMIKQLIAYMGHLEHTGGLVLPPNTVPGDLIPSEILSGPFVTLFDENYDLDLTVFGSIAKSDSNEFAKLELLIANRVEPEVIYQYLKQYAVYPHSYRRVFKTIDVSIDVIQPVEPVRSIVVDPVVARQLLSVNPRDLIMGNDY